MAQAEMALPLAKRSTSRERWAWYLYDFGNSAYAAVVLLAVYSAFFQGTVVGGAEGSRLWGIAVGIAMLIVALTAPILGAIADFSAAKKRFLLIYTALCCVGTALLFTVGEGNIFTGMLFFIIAEVGYRSAQVFYNGLLPDIAAPEEMGKISGNGWAIGSLGGIVCLLIVLGLILTIGGEFIVRISMVLTAVFFAVSALPIFFWLRERAEPQAIPAGENYLTVGFRRLGETVRKVRDYREFVKFIVAFLIYNDGILMALDFAAIIGAVLFGMDQQQLIIFMILVQVASVVGAYLFGLLANNLQARRALIISLILMIIAVAWIFFSTSITSFYAIGALAGFALTGVQSVSRGVVGIFAPEGQSAEFYGFFGLAGRTSSFIGPTVFGVLAVAATNRIEASGVDSLFGIGLMEMGTGTLAEQLGHRVAVFTIVIFLVVGLVVLLTVNEKKGREAAMKVAAPAEE